MKSIWVIAFVAMLVAVVVQTTRLQEFERSYRESRLETARLSSLELVYRRHVLSQVRQSLLRSIDTVAEDEKTQPDQVLYMVAERSCGACRRALDAFRERGVALPLLIGSFHDSADVLEAWIREMAVPAQVVAGADRSQVFDVLPRGATPIFLEVAGGEPIDLKVGQPKDRWFKASSLP